MRSDCNECLDVAGCDGVCQRDLSIEEQSLVFRLRRRAEIRRTAVDRESVKEGREDRLANLLDEAAHEIYYLTHVKGKDIMFKLDKE